MRECSKINWGMCFLSISVADPFAVLLGKSAAGLNIHKVTCACYTCEYNNGFTGLVHVHRRDIDQLWARVVSAVRIGNYFRQPDRWYILRDQSGDYPILRFFIACYKLHGFGKCASVALRSSCRSLTFHVNDDHWYLSLLKYVARGVT